MINEEKDKMTNNQDTMQKSGHQDSQIQSDSSRPKSFWRWLRWGGYFCLFCLFGLIVFLCTGYGQRKTIQWVDHLVEPLQINNIDGSIQDGLILTGTQFVMDGVNVQLGKIQVHIGFECLLHYEVCLNNFSAKDSAVVIDTTKLSQTDVKNERQPFTGLNLPLDLIVKQIELENIAVKVDELDIHLDHFHTAFLGQGRTITLKETMLDGVKVVLAPNVAEEKQNQQAEKQKIDWDTIKTQFEKPLLDKQNPIRLPLDLSIEDVSIRNVEVSQKVKNKEGKFVDPFSLIKIALLKLQADISAEKIALNLDFQSDQANAKAAGSLLLDRNYPLTWNLDANSTKNTTFDLPFTHLKANISGALFEKTAVDLNMKGAITATLSGQIELAKANTPFDFLLKSDSIRYPFSSKINENTLRLEKNTIHLQGDLKQYKVDASLNANGMGLPASSASLIGQGELTNFQFQDLILNTLGGKAQLKGRLDWTDGLEWDAYLNTNNVNTRALVTNWPAVLSGGLKSTGYVGRGNTGEEWQVKLGNIDIQGSLLQKHLQLKGEVNASHSLFLESPALSLVYGENKIELKGILSEASDFNIDIKAPNLQGLLPTLQASINGKMKVLGKLSSPNLDVDLVLANAAYQQMKLQHFSAKGKVNVEQSTQGNIELGLRHFSYNDIKIDNASISLQGNEHSHLLKLNSAGTPLQANLQISGKFDRLQQRWEGQLSQVALKFKEIGKLQPNKTIQVKYDHNAINADISSHCWQHDKTRLCFPSEFNAGIEGKIPFELHNFDLAVLQQYLGENSELSGIVNAKGNAAWFKNKLPEVNVELTSHLVKYLQKMEGGMRFPIAVSPFKADLKLSDDNLSLKSNWQIENNGKLSTDLMMKGISQSRALSGNIKIDKLSLNLLRPLLSRGDAIDGNIHANLTVGGSVSSPLLNGRLNLNDLKARSAMMPFDVTGGGLAIHFQGAKSTLSGQIQAEQSTLKLDGEADWRNLNAWKTRIHAYAQRFPIDIPNIAKVAISPDVQVTVTPTKLTLSGNIDIPWARIEVEGLPESAVSVSDDEIIMDTSVKKKVPLSQRTLPSQTAGGMGIDADVNISIGNDVKLKAYGLNSNLSGLLAVRQGKQGLGLYGQVRLNQGRFAAYGQDLLIRKGNISFAGMPSQPSLDIEAIRNPEAMEDPTIIAGVRVSGLADNPTVKVFSEPAMSQNEAFSYILTGRSLESGGDGNSSNAVAAALLSMSLSKSSKLVGDIGSAFGLKDLSVTTAGIGDNTKVEVSASLSPKFKVKYGVGIFAPLTELTLRYNITQKLYLQWVSNISQAVDLMYRFEFDELF